jgi:hypothetical protein
VPTFAVTDADRDVGVIGTDQEIDVVYRISNTGGKPVRIVGAVRDTCGLDCCFYPKDAPDGRAGLHVIPPGGFVDFVCVLTARRAGPIKADTSVFIDDDGIRNVRLSVRGTAVAAGGLPHAQSEK